MSGMPGGNEAMLRVMEYAVLALGVFMFCAAGFFLALLVWLAVYA